MAASEHPGPELTRIMQSEAHGGTASLPCYRSAVSAFDSLRDAVALRSILEDAGFAARAFSTIIALGTDKGSTPAMCLIPSFCLITHETRRWFMQNHPDIASQLPTAEVGRIEMIRHGAKWFDSSRDGVEGAMSRFREMTESHASFFTGNARLVWARRFEPDLGLYSYKNTVVLSTHLLGSLIGPEVPVAGTTWVREMSSSVSAQVASLVGLPLPSEPSFLTPLGSFTRRDVKSWEYYRRGAIHDLATSGYLHGLSSSLGFLSLLDSAGPEDAGSVFKLQFVGLYHAVKSIKLLRLSELRDFDSSVPPGLLDGPSARWLRNTLVHYSPHDHVSSDALDPDRPRQAQVENALNCSFEVASDQTRTAIRSVRDNLTAVLGQEIP